MPWGRVTITYEPVGYNQNYKRCHVVTHTQCQNMVIDALIDSVVRIMSHPPTDGFPPDNMVVNRTNIAQNLASDPGDDYQEI